MEVDIKILNSKLDIQQSVEWASTPSCGGINIFIGTVRNQTKGKKVLRLEFEAYEKMAINELHNIAEKAFQKWPVEKILIHHRSGTLQVGEVPVIIVVAAAHRDAAFDACRYIIDTLKETVPIWKKEHFEDGAVWVAAHP